MILEIVVLLFILFFLFLYNLEVLLQMTFEISRYFLHNLKR